MLELVSIHLFATLIFVTTVSRLGQAQEADTANLASKGEPVIDRDLAAVFHDYHEQYLTLFPLEATAFGDMRYNDSLPIRISSDFKAKEQAFYRRTLSRLAELDIGRASESLHLAAQILSYEMKSRLAGLELDHERIPWNQFDGLPLSFGQLGSGAGNQPFKTVRDYENWLKRIDAYSIWVDVAIDQFRRGMADKFVLPAKLVHRMIAQCEDPSIVSSRPEESLFFEPINRMPDSISAADRQRLSDAYRVAVATKVLPAYRRMATFLRDEYLPQSRSSSGIGALSGGKQHYEYWVRYWTTTDLTPDEIFSTGEAEVRRIRAEMEKVRMRMNFHGNLQEFFTYVRTDSAFMPFQSADQVLAAYRAIQTRLEPNVDKMFRGRPKTAFEIRRTEAFREKTASAEYNPGSADGSRPGIFYVPIPDAKTFNVASGMESLFLHEAIPGHHYQVSLTQENQQIPTFARFLWYGAYGEGWALYCESLGSELGLYTDPKQLMGALGDEMHRAIRLVVDVGMHWKGWTREQALEYMLANEPISEAGATAEIERYMAVPGQALAYKIGQLKIRQLRTQYEKELSDRFNLAEFHHCILKDGCMPLSILETRVAQWAKEISGAKKTSGAP